MQLSHRFYEDICYDFSQRARKCGLKEVIPINYSVMFEEELKEIEEKKKSRKVLTASLVALFLMLVAKVVYVEVRTHFSASSPFRYLLPFTFLLIISALAVAVVATKNSIIQLKSLKNGKNYIALLINIFVISSIIYDFFHRSLI